MRPVIRALRLVLTLTLTIGISSCNKKPVASFVPSPPAASPPAQIRFDASASHDPDGRIKIYLWKFGDGTTAQGPIATHVYSKPGSYVVTLAVTDNDDATVITQQTVRVFGTFSAKPIQLPGLLGGAAQTSVYRIDASQLGLSSIASFAIVDDGLGNGVGGQFSGFGLDAVVVSTIACSTSECINQLQSCEDVNQCPNRMILFPGAIHNNDGNPLFGTTPDGDRINNAIATLGKFDATFLPGAPRGFVSLGDGGQLRANLQSPLPSKGLNIYFGGVGGKSVPTFFASDVPYPVPNNPALFPSVKLLVAPPFVLVYFPDAVSGTDIKFSAGAENGLPVAYVGPTSLPVSQEKPMLLFYESSNVESGRGGFLHAGIDQVPLVVPTLRVAHASAVTAIKGPGKFSYVPTLQAAKWIDVNGHQVEVFDIDFSSCVAGGCTATQLQQLFEDYIRTWAKLGDKEHPFGITFVGCEYQPSQVSVVKETETGLGLIVVTVAAHIPKLHQQIYVPSQKSMDALKGCSATDKQSLLDQIRDHEALHAQNHEEWTPSIIEEGSSVFFPESYDSATPEGLERLKKAGYAEWCRDNVMPKLDEYDTLHEKYGWHVDTSRISCDCVIGRPDRDPAHPEVNCKPTSSPAPQGYHCSCKKGFGDYPSALDCIAKCEVDLSCFDNSCTPIKR